MILNHLFLNFLNVRANCRWIFLFWHLVSLVKINYSTLNLPSRGPKAKSFSISRRVRYIFCLFILRTQHIRSFFHHRTSPVQSGRVSRRGYNHILIKDSASSRGFLSLSALTKPYCFFHSFLLFLLFFHSLQLFFLVCFWLIFFIFAFSSSSSTKLSLVRLIPLIRFLLSS